jgi:outer membrane receptor protein involved in Fe transport
MHTSYDLNKTNQLQLNYSKRVSRPDEDNLNPFPEYQDPYNLNSGNPNLKPEQIHSIEAGYLNHNGATTYTGSIYYRYNYNKFTEITKFINDSVLLTTQENLSSGSAAGIEAIVNSSLGKFATVNLNINGYFSQLDAANLGYSSSKTAFGWFSSFNTNISI